MNIGTGGTVRRREDTDDYGLYAPDGYRLPLIRLTRALPENWLGQRLGYALRRLVLDGRNAPFDIEVFGWRTRLYPQDNKCERRVICLPQFFDPQERRILKEYAQAQTKPKQDFNFIDLGANIGLYSLYMASLGLPDLRILAVEADPQIFARLDYNIRLNALPVTALNVAASNTNGFASLAINTRNRGENSIAPAPARDQGAQQRISIPCRTLPDMMDEARIRRPDILKLDLEGAEEAVLDYFFEVATPERYPGLILIEDAPERWSSDVFGMLERVGYVLTNRTKANRFYRLK